MDHDNQLRVVVTFFFGAIANPPANAATAIKNNKGPLVA
jgi:hypothetical protein